MAALRLRFGAELRTRWRAWIGLALLIGLAAGAVIALAAGARRTETAYSRFLDDVHGFDVVAFPDFCAGLDDLEPGDEPPVCFEPELVARLPQVAESVIVRQYPHVEITTRDGHNVQPNASDSAYTGPGEVALVGSADGRYGTTVNRLRIVDGRAPDPNRPEEVVIPRALADRLGIGVGSTLRARLELFDAEGVTDGSPGQSAPITFRVVGIEVGQFEIPPPSGEWFSPIHTTPAFDRSAVEQGARVESAVAVRLGEGDDVASFQAELDRRRIRAGLGFLQADQTAAIERATRPQSVALLLIGALLALAAVAVLGQALSRQAFLDSTDHPVLGVLGLSRSQLWGLGMARAGAIGIGAAALGAGVAFLASPLMPIGLARDAEPDAGLHLDGAALVGGALLTLVLVLLLSALPAWRMSRAGRAGASGTSEQLRPSAVAGAIGRTSMPLPASIGVRMALEPGRGRTAVPVRTSILSVVVAVVVIVAALSYSNSLNHLLATPRLTGWNWDVMMLFDSEDSSGRFSPDDVRTALERQPEVEAYAPGTFFQPFPDHPLQLGQGRRDVLSLSFGDDGKGIVEPSVLEGRAPRAPNEILIGPETLDELGLEVGDTVMAFGQVGDGGPNAYEDTSAEMKVVGSGLVPVSGGAGRLGRGAALTIDGLRTLNPLVQPELVWVRLRDGAGTRPAIDGLRRSLGGGGGITFGTEPERVEDLENLEQIDNVPLVLAGLMAVMAAGVLTHVLVSAVRVRRRDLAILKSLGLSRGQVRTSVAWQATTLAAIALVVALPLGLALGRWVWRLFAENLGVIPEPWVQWWTIVGVVLGVFAVAYAAATVPALLASRARPAEVLRAE